VRGEPEKLPDNFIRVNKRTQPGVFVDEVMKLFQEKKATEVTLSAIGMAIPKVLVVAETVTHRIGGLHQVSSIQTQKLTDLYEPKEEHKDLEQLTIER